MPKMTDDQLLHQIETLERQALGYWTGEVAQEQAKAMDYYLGKPFGTEEEGRSSVVSTDVWDVVEGLTPLVLKPFVASDDVVRFNPLGPDDEKAAQQESEYINWVVTQRNDSFNQLVAWVKTGLLQKNGVVKYWWEQSTNTSIERYFGVPDDVLTLIAQDEGVEVVELSETVTPDGQVLNDVVLRVSEPVGHARYCVLPPEEFLIARDATCPDPKAASFVQHRRMVTIGELRDMGYDVPDTISDEQGYDTEYSQQFQARSGQDETSANDEGNDPTAKKVLFRESFLLVDFDGDGKQELRKVCAVGRELLSNEETEEIPFCAWTPYPQPFKFYGRCPADETLEIQLVKSTLWRQSLDNIYTINNNRTYVNESVNLDDLIDNQIAGVVRIKGNAPVGNSITNAPITPIGAVVQPMMEYLDSAKENRTGFTRYNQGSDSNTLNKTATGIRVITESANQRVEIIARAFAEQGLAPLMRGIHGLCRRHATKQETIRLRNEWVPIDPRGWKKRMDVAVSVGLGTADQQMRMQGVQLLLQEQKQLAQAGIVQPKNFLAAAHKLAEVVGFKNPEEFFSAAEEKGLPPEAQQAMQGAAQEIQALRQELQKLQSGIVAKQIDAQSRQAVEALKADTAVLIARIDADRAQDREELKGLIALLKQKMQPPPQLAEAVSEDMNKGSDGQA